MTLPAGRSPSQESPEPAENVLIHPERNDVAGEDALWLTRHTHFSRGSCCDLIQRSGVSAPLRAQSAGLDCIYLPQKQNHFVPRT